MIEAPDLAAGGGNPRQGGTGARNVAHGRRAHAQRGSPTVKRLARGILAGLGLLLAPSVAAQHVQVAGGLVAASEESGGALLFRAIPFAAPPTGERRWRAPGAVVPWSGVRADNPDAPACAQNDYGWNRADYLRSSEDCLTLDVRTPRLGGKLPVMVWIHGGSNRAGSARGTVLSGIGAGKVVLVSIQYRLGILGFLAHRGAAAEAGGHAGNYGLMDQIAALRWVRDNVANFGGDPENVTIFGHSAGAQDVTLLLAAPEARGLFHKAIAQSGTPGFGIPFRSLESALEIGDQADKLLDGGGSIEMLRRTSLPALLAADLKLADPGLPSNDFLWLNTVIDGAVLPRSPRELLAEGPRRPVIIGSNRAEFADDKPDWDKALAARFGANAARARAFYGIGSGAVEDERLGPAWLQFGTDWTFRCPAGRVAELLARIGSPVWRYELDLNAEDGGRTRHGAELAYVLGEARFRSGNFDTSLQDYWTNFARTGDPNGELPHWPAFTGKGRAHVLFDAAGVHREAMLREPICSMLEEL